MAAIDYAGLLTGISGQNQKADPFSMPTAAQQRMAFGAQTSQGMQQGLGNLFGTDFRSPAQKIKEQLIQLNPNSTADQPKIVQLLRVVDPQASFAMEEKFKVENAKLLANQKRRESLIEQAGALGLENTADLLRNNGDMNEAAKQIRKIEESDTLASKGIKGKLAVARQYNAPESILKDIQKGIYNQTSPEELLKVIRGDKADLKAFLNEEGETVYGRVNDFSAKVYDEETDQWATPSELGYTPAPVVTKQISSADSVVKQLTAGATKSFLEVNKAGQAAKKILQTNAISRDILGEGARTGFGTEWANKTLEIINTTGLLPEKYMDGVAASKALMASRSLAVLDMIPVFGGGQGFTEKDREFLTNIKGADFSLDSKTIARLLDLEERAARQAIELNNNSLDQVMKLAAVSGETPTDLTSVFYITPPAQREVAPVGAGSTMTPETEAYLRAQGLIQ
jgi:hypothetical protein